MSTTNPAIFSPGGLAYPSATELARQIDGTADAKLLCQIGFSYPVAVELARQMVVGTGNVAQLVACGLNPALAVAIKGAIDL